MHMPEAYPMTNTPARSHADTHWYIHKTKILLKRFLQITAIFKRVCLLSFARYALLVFTWIIPC